MILQFSNQLIWKCFYFFIYFYLFNRTYLKICSVDHIFSLKTLVLQLLWKNWSENLPCIICCFFLLPKTICSLLQMMHDFLGSHQKEEYGALSNAFMVWVWLAKNQSYHVNTNKLNNCFCSSSLLCELHFTCILTSNFKTLRYPICGRWKRKNQL